MAILSVDVDVEVPFHDVDSVRIVWHGHYIKYFELARTALIRRIGYDCAEMEASGYVWPVVECHVKYIASAHYGQQLRVTAELLEYENRMKVGYQIVDAQTGQRLTKAYTVQVAVSMDNGEMQFVSPAALTDKVRAICVVS